MAAVAAGLTIATTLTAHATEEPAPPTLRVSGVAGTVIWVDVAPHTVLNNAGFDTDATADRGGWAGVTVVQPASRDNKVKAHFYLGLDLPEAYRCPDSTCPWTVPPPTATSGLNDRLPPGRYRLILLGVDGAHVQVSIHPTSGAIRIARGADRDHVRLVTQTTKGVGAAPGRETSLHSFGAVPPGHGWALAVSYAMYAIKPAGLIATNTCLTGGPTDTAIASIGGVGPCADTQGEDFLYVPGDVGPSTGMAGYAPVDAAPAYIYGPQLGDSLGVGRDDEVVAPTSYLRDLFIGFALPY